MRPIREVGRGGKNYQVQIVVLIDMRSKATELVVGVIDAPCGE